MDWQTVQQNWEAYFAAIEERWPEVDEADLIEIDGDRDRFVDYLAETAGTSPDDAGDQVEAWLIEQTALPADVRMDDHRDNANIRESGQDIPTGEDVYSDDGRFGSGDWDDKGPSNPLGRTK